jgi:hypothetical protein
MEIAKTTLATGASFDSDRIPPYVTVSWSSSDEALAGLAEREVSEFLKVLDSHELNVRSQAVYRQAKSAGYGACVVVAAGEASLSRLRSWLNSARKSALQKGET